MINILSYVGMNMHSEVCLWTVLGLVRTIFDATLFKVNANLIQVWQMSMPDELSLPVQRVLRTIISGVMLVQCFTVYVYLASYIVLLYPVFLEERPPLVLPWLLLAATRKLLCELTCLAVGLGTCVLLGPAKPPCIKFVIVKLISIMPAFYMWMLVYSYYHALKVATAFKTFATVLPTSDHDFGLELAIRRRRTKSLLGEEQLRNHLVASLYGQRPVNVEKTPRQNMNVSSRAAYSPDTSIDDIKTDVEIVRPTSVMSNRLSDTGSYEDWYGSSDVVVPRDADRILEQFVLMMLRIGAYLHKEGTAVVDFDILKQKSSHDESSSQNYTTTSANETDIRLAVLRSNGNNASYVREYPQIFMKRALDIPHSSENKIAAVKTVHSHVENYENGNVARNRKQTASISLRDRVPLNNENINKIIVPRADLQEKKQMKHKQSTSISSRGRVSLNTKNNYNKKVVATEELKDKQQQKNKRSSSIYLRDRVSRESDNNLNRRIVPREELQEKRQKKSSKIENQQKETQTHQGNNSRSPDKKESEFKLNSTLSSSDSLQHVIDNINRLINNDQSLSQNDEASSSDPNKNKRNETNK